MPHHCKVRVAVCETNVYVCVGCRYKIVRIKLNIGNGWAEKKCWNWCRTAATAVKGAARCCREGWVKQVSKNRVSTYPDMCDQLPPDKRSTRTSSYVQYSSVRVREYLHGTRKATFRTSPRWEKNLCVLTTTVWAQSDIALSLTVETKSSSHIFQLNLIFVVFNPTFNPHLLLPFNFSFFFLSLFLSRCTLCFCYCRQSRR